MYMLNEAQFILYFHSAMRNVGLFTSICIAVLAAANAAAAKYPKRGVAWGPVRLYHTAVILLVSGVFFNRQLLSDFDANLAALDEARGQAEDKPPRTIDFQAWKHLPRAVLVCQVLLGCVLLVAIFRRRAVLFH